MGHHQGGASLAQLVQSLLNQQLGGVIQGAGGLVQNENGRVFQEDTGDGDALLLPAGKTDSPLPHQGFVPLGLG